MSTYKKHTASTTEWAGESFTVPLHKTADEEWATNEEANYKLIDTNGTVQSSGAVSKSVDNIYFVVHVPKADTVGLSGKTVLLVYQTDTDDVTVSNVIAEYKITYKAESA